jgi:hypothetical protein
MPDWVNILKPLLAKSDDAFGEWTTEQLAEALAARRNKTAPAGTNRQEPQTSSAAGA